MRSDGDDDSAQDPAAPSPPNPLGGNEIKLTLPGQDRPRAVGGVFGDESVFDEQSADEGPAETAVDSDGDEGTADAGEVDGALDHDAQLAAGAGEPGESSYAALPSRSRRLPDRSVLRVLGAIVAAVVVLGGVAWWSASPAEQPDPAGQVSAPVIPTGARPPGGGGQPGPVEEAPLPVTASSGCPNQTDPQLATSTDPDSAWTCPTEGVPFGQKLVLTLPKPYVVTGICFWPGFNGVAPDGRPAWFQHRLIEQAQIVFNDPDATVIELRPMAQRHEYCVPLNKIVASGAELTIQQTTAPPPEPRIDEPGAPPGSPDAPQTPDVTSLFPPAGESDDLDEGPQAASVAIWGLQLVGRPIL